MDKLDKHQEKFSKTNAILQNHLNKRNAQHLDLRLLEKDIENVYQQARQQYSEDLREREKNIAIKSLIRNAFKKYSRLSRAIKNIGDPGQSLGPGRVPPFDERLNEMLGQQKDILRSIEDLTQVVKEIDASSAEIFYSTFKKVQANFHLLFRRLFNGGAGKILLTDEKDPLHSGIDILIQPPGKKFQNINLLSGGEKSLIAISLMFAIFLVRPAPICLLDEVDASLDKINIDRLSKMLFEFRNVTQFVIITHNEKTASIADYVHGVTMHGGVSHIYSYTFSVKKPVKTATK